MPHFHHFCTSIPVNLDSSDQEHSFKTLSTSTLCCRVLWDIKGKALG